MYHPDLVYIVNSHSGETGISGTSKTYPIIFNSKNNNLYSCSGLGQYTENLIVIKDASTLHLYLFMIGALPFHLLFSLQSKKVEIIFHLARVRLKVLFQGFQTEYKSRQCSDKIALLESLGFSTRNIDMKRFFFQQRKCCFLLTLHSCRQNKHWDLVHLPVHYMGFFI